ncbi:hypothetical protein GFB74_18945, partial [Escherichia coli]|nr:hypothetical protein [Escherichia coli]
MNDLSTYFGVNTAVVTPFAYENALNTLITNLDLFDVQYHTENSILLTDLIDQFVQVAGGFAPIFPDICYHLTHYKPAAADIPVASDNPAHYA